MSGDTPINECSLPPKWAVALDQYESGYGPVRAYIRDLHADLAALRAERDRLKEAYRILTEWYERDGSVGGASLAFEDARRALGEEYAMPLISDDEIAALLDRHTAHPAKSWHREAIREAIRLTAERCAQLCDQYPERDPAEDGNGYWAAADCAQAIRDAAK